MRLWIDDVRPAPDGWTWVKTSDEALAILGPDVIQISFDHDLGGDDTAMIVAKEIEHLAFLGERAPPKWSIHSANPVGRLNLQAALQRADEFWNSNSGSE